MQSAKWSDYYTQEKKKVIALHRVLLEFLVIIIMRQNSKRMVVNNDFQAVHGGHMPLQLTGPNSSMSN